MRKEQKSVLRVFTKPGEAVAAALFAGAAVMNKNAPAGSRLFLMAGRAKGWSHFS
jgi:hypothetical protein